MALNHHIEALDSEAAAVNEPAYVGMQSCAGCHSEQVSAWRRSHHDMAMQVASADTVLADFNNTEYNYFGTQSKFYRKGENFWVKTDGPDGQLTDYQIRYTFGYFPLQQYLIEFPDGRLQALNVVWDSRSKAEGGQRWFHLYPNEHIDHQDELHWTGINQNWNYMCADCHSTGLEKNYDAASNRYKTDWQEIDVSCEACHGPAEHHIDWANLPAPEQISSQSKIYDNKGFKIRFDERSDIVWAIDPQSGNAKRNKPMVRNKEIEVCAACHSRRVTSHSPSQPRQSFLDNYQLSLRTPPLYYVDGQVNEEVYVYGSFLQSKMHQAGVTCSDCHQPHSLKLRAQGNALCSQCHLASKYDNPGHHLHRQNAPGGQCVDCHMPAKNFMVVDARRDHSLRIPRPDLSVDLGVPNACNSCHQDKSPQWAAEQLHKHYGTPPVNIYPHAINAAISQQSDAESLLAQVLMDDSLPSIKRATAASLLPTVMSKQAAPLLQMVAQGDDPLLGLGLAVALDNIPTDYRAAFAVPLLFDKQRITRELAAQSLAGVSLTQFPQHVQHQANITTQSYLASQHLNAERPEALTNLADYYMRTNAADQAIDFYKAAISRGPHYTPAYVNFADAYRQLGNEQAARKVLKSGIEVVHDNATLHYALGLSLVREGQLNDALPHLRQAASSVNAPARFRYVYALGLDSSGDSNAALLELEKALQDFPNNLEVLSALVSINQKNGNTDKAEFYKSQLM